MRGFGGPQAMVVIEEILDRIARALRLPPEVVRERNLYRGEEDSARTHYGQLVDVKRMRHIWNELLKSSDYKRRRAAITRWNGFSPHEKRGMAITPVKFGISFTFTPLNQAGSLVLIYQDGTVQVNHGGIEMGQGLHTNIRSIAASRLGIGINKIRVMQTSTDKVPNTSATAASTGTDLNGAAVDEACKVLVQRLTRIAHELFQERHGYIPGQHDLTFRDDSIYDIKHPELKALAFNDLVKQAYLRRVNLSAVGYCSTPDLAWDREKGSGKPFHYFVYGAAVSEVQVDGFTGQHKVLRVDILQDAGNPVNTAISLGQVEGAFIQGMGWVTMEELKWDDKGRLLTHSPDTYKIPTISDMPDVFNVKLLPDSKQKNVIHGAKSVGEPPFMLAISVREALRDAVASFGPSGDQIALALPATCEKVWFAIQDRWKATEGVTVAAEATQYKPNIAMTNN
jgi:xanthine dehydrogenase molybdopterin-binding subunit B